MKVFDLSAIQGMDYTVMKVVGSQSEKNRLINYLTIKNKSIGFQLMKAKEQLTYWRNVVFKSNELGAPNGYAQGKLDALNKLLPELQEKYVTEYYTIIDDELYIPSGFYYLIKNCPGNLYQSNIEPVIIPGMRDYQVSMVQEMLKVKRGIGVLATGLGKSFCILSLTSSFVKLKKRVCIIVPTDYLVGQVYNLLNQHISSITAAGGGRNTKLGCDVLVTTMQSALKFTSDYDVLIGDEAQHASAETLQNIFLNADKAEYVYGVTATPFRADGLDLGINAFCGPIVYQKDVKWGIANNWLADPKIYLKHLAIKHDKVKKSSLKTTAYKYLCGHPITIDYVCEQLQKGLAAGRKCIVITKTLDVAKKIRKGSSGFEKFDIADAKYKKPLHDFQQGKTNVLVATVNLISEGVDIPDADLLIVLTQHSSSVTTLQAIGRVLRKSPNKKDPIVIDVCITEGYDGFIGAADKRLKDYNNITPNITILKG